MIQKISAALPAVLLVALKDFIVGFFGWLVLMGRNGIRLGDWVEINGVSGEVTELGMFHTVLLETGNWSDAGHPTGRRVTFTNSFAIERHYFNFWTPIRSSMSPSKSPKRRPRARVKPNRSGSAPFLHREARPSPERPASASSRSSVEWRLRFATSPEPMNAFSCGRLCTRRPCASWGRKRSMQPARLSQPVDGNYKADAAFGDHPGNL